MSDPELNREEAIELADDLSLQLYRAQDRVAFVREMLATRTGTVEVADVLTWLDHEHCPRAESEQQQIARLTARIAEMEHINELERTHVRRFATYVAWTKHLHTCWRCKWVRACAEGRRLETAHWDQVAALRTVRRSLPAEQERRDECQHRDPKQLGHRPGDLALVCSCGAQVLPMREHPQNNRTHLNETRSP